jgi:hypothetical protein
MCHHVAVILSYVQGKTLVVERETLEFSVTLSNPYVFELELQNLSLRYITHRYILRAVLISFQ